MRKVRREREKVKVRAKAKARRVIDQDPLVRLGLQPKRRRSHVDFTLVREQHALKDEIVNTVTHKGFTKGE